LRVGSQENRSSSKRPAFGLRTTRQPRSGWSGNGQKPVPARDLLFSVWLKSSRFTRSTCGASCGRRTDPIRNCRQTLHPGGFRRTPKRTAETDRSPNGRAIAGGLQCTESGPGKRAGETFATRWGEHVRSWTSTGSSTSTEMPGGKTRRPTSRRGQIAGQEFRCDRGRTLDEVEER